jgi:hypothetical protein
MVEGWERYGSTQFLEQSSPYLGVPAVRTTRFDLLHAEAMLFEHELVDQRLFYSLWLRSVLVARKWQES